MSQENVVLFEAWSRRAMARRGCLDKAVSAKMDVSCPYCGAVLRVEANSLTPPVEALCGDCGLVIDVEDRGRVDGRA